MVSVLVAIVAIPWVLIALAPVGFFLLLGAVGTLRLVYNLFFGKLKISGQSAETITLERMIRDYIGQWPEEVHAFARKTENSGCVSLMIQFSSGNNKWNRSTRAMTLSGAVLNMKRKLLSGPMPEGFSSSRKFDEAPTLPACEQFIELYPQGLCG